MFSVDFAVEFLRELLALLFDDDDAGAARSVRSVRSRFLDGGGFPFPFLPPPLPPPLEVSLLPSFAVEVRKLPGR